MLDFDLLGWLSFNVALICIGGVLTLWNLLRVWFPFGKWKYGEIPLIFIFIYIFIIVNIQNLRLANEVKD